MTKILVLYYSMYGHVETMAQAVVEGARTVEGTVVTLKRVADLMPEEVARQAGAKLDQQAPMAVMHQLGQHMSLLKDALIATRTSTQSSLTLDTSTS